MHDNSRNIMKAVISRHLNPAEQMTVADIGAMNINGCYREYFPYPRWVYTGFDLSPGPNVDVVLASPDNWGINEQFDAVISGQTLEHVKDIYRFAEQLTELSRKYLVVIAPNTFREHRFPFDCWRFWPDGMRYLFCERNGWTELECAAFGIDTYIDGVKG
jgi:hypothetical protein